MTNNLFKELSYNELTDVDGGMCVVLGVLAAVGIVAGTAVVTAGAVVLVGKVAQKFSDWIG